MRRYKIKNWREYPHELFYMAGVMCLVLQLLHLRHYVLLCENPDLGFISFGVRSVTDALLMLLPYWLLPARWRVRWVGFAFIAFSIWGLAQLWYYRTYHDLMPFCSFLLFDNVSSLLINSIRASMRWMDIGFIAPPVLLIFVYRILFAKRMKSQPVKRGKRGIYTAIILVCSLLIHSINAYVFYKKEHNRTAKHLLARYVNTINQISYFDYNGFVPLCIHSAVNAILEKRSLNDEENAEIELFLSNHTPRYTDNGYAVGEGKNLILIVVESLNSWLINFELDGVEIMPCLNKLCQDSTSIIALQMKPQVKDGRSSDAHFMFNTGLLPINNGAVAVRYPCPQFPSLAKALKGYESLSMVCDNAKFWNQNKAFEAYGIEQLYDAHWAGSQSGCIDDLTLLKNAANKLKSTKQPFYAQIITIGMHYPYDKLDVPPTTISRSRQYTKEIRNFLEKAHYCDNAIAGFIQEMKDAGIYEKSLIAIISDHNEVDRNVIENRPSPSPQDKEIAMIVLGAPQGMNYTEKMEQIDVYPTLLDLMGVNHYPWKGLGRSIFRKDSVPGMPSISMDKRREYISDLMITKGYFKKK